MLGINQRLAIIREAFIKKTPATPIESNETGLLDDTSPLSSLQLCSRHAKQLSCYQCCYKKQQLSTGGCQKGLEHCKHSSPKEILKICKALAILKAEPWTENKVSGMFQGIQKSIDVLGRLCESPEHSKCVNVRFFARNKQELRWSSKLSMRKCLTTKDRDSQLRWRNFVDSLRNVTLSQPRHQAVVNLTEQRLSALYKNHCYCWQWNAGQRSISTCHP